MNEGVQFVWQNCEKLHFCLRYVSLLKEHRRIVLFTSDVMYKKYNLVTSLILLARFCKVKLSNKKFGLILILASLLDKGMQPFNYNV